MSAPVWARGWLATILVVAIVATGSLAQAKGSGSDSGAPPKLPEPLTKEAIRELVSRLDDDQVRQLLLAQLDRAAVAGTPKKPGSDPMAMATDMAAKSQRLPELAAGVAALPGQLLEARGRFLEGRGPGHFLLVAVLFALMLMVGFLVERLFGWGTRRLRQSIPAQRNGFAGQVSRFVLELVLELVTLVGFVVGCLGFFFGLYQGHVPTRQLVFTYLTAVVIVRLVALLSRSVLAPGSPEHRLLPLGAAASRLHWGLLWLAAIYAFGIGTIQLLGGLGVAHDTLDGLGLLVGVLFLTLAIQTVWGIRAEVAGLIRGPGEPGPLRRLLAESWAILATAYLLVVFLSRVSEVLSGENGPSKAPILSVVLLVALPLVDMLLGRMLGGLFTRAEPAPGSSDAPGTVTGDGGASPTTAGGQAPGTGMTFEPVLLRALHIVVMVGGLLILADLWDLNIFDLAERGMGARISSALLGIGITLLLAWTMWEFAQTAINRQMVKEAGPVTAERGEEGSDRPATRLRTLLPLFRGLILTTIVVMATLSTLSALGVNIVPLLAGAGVFGLAIGFGSQTLVRDVVSGAFFLMDDAFRIGEYIEAGDSKGTVEKINIRSLHVRHHRGALNIVPYGEIKRLRNNSRDWMIMTLEFRVPYDTDLLKVKKIIKRIGEDLMKDPEMGPDLLQPLKSQGVMATDDAGLLIRAKFMSKPTSTPYLVRREAYMRILKAFAAEGIRFGSRQVTVLTSGGGGGSVVSAVALPAAGAAATAAEPES